MDLYRATTKWINNFYAFRNRKEIEWRKIATLRLFNSMSKFFLHFKFDPSSMDWHSHEYIKVPLENFFSFPIFPSCFCCWWWSVVSYICNAAFSEMMSHRKKRTATEWNKNNFRLAYVKKNIRAKYQHFIIVPAHIVVCSTGANEDSQNDWRWERTIVIHSKNIPIAKILFCWLLSCPSARSLATHHVRSSALSISEANKFSYLFCLLSHQNDKF